ncbi:MAG: sigma-70 family RNA polymerase sigma factor [Minisyncoccia bacterium]
MAKNGNGRLDDQSAQFQKELLELMPFTKAFARSLCGNREGADDLVQDALIKAWKARDSFILGTNLKAWLFTILRNEWFSNRRRAWRQEPWDPVLAERTLTTDGELSEAEATENFRRLLSCISCLTQEQADAVIAVGYLGKTYDEAAAMLGCAVGTAKSRVARGRKELRYIIDRASIANVNVDELRRAAQGVPKTHPYYPIAKAYEELFSALTDHTNGALEKNSGVETGWHNLIGSGALNEDGGSLNDLLQGDALEF